MVKSPVDTFRIFCLEEHLEISFRADPFSVIAAPLELIKSTFLSQHDSKNKSINNYPYLYQIFLKKQILLWTWLSSYKRKNIILSHIIFLQILWQTAKRSSYSFPWWSHPPVKRNICNHSMLFSPGIYAFGITPCTTVLLGKGILQITK